MNHTYTFPSIRTDGLILILGLGETGVAAARWCAAHGASLRVLDTRVQAAGLDQLREYGIDADQHLGPDALQAQALDDVHTLVLSPGLNPHEPRLEQFLAQARSRGVEVLGEIELFARALADLRPQGYEPALVAITGTNGKTTVTSMVRHLAESCGLKARSAGNIGPAALAGLYDALDQDDLPGVWVVELSSFQLQATTTLRPDVAAVLNVSQDHLDWHGSMDAYVAAKRRLPAMARLTVINRDDPLVTGMVDELSATNVCSFGAGAPSLAGDLGIVRENGLDWLALAAAPMMQQEPATGRGRNKKMAAASRAGAPVQALMPAGALQIRGAHNIQNALAALALGLAAGFDLAGMLHGLRDYRGEAHRTEYIRTIAGVEFIDDSKGTNVGATLAALQGLGRPVVLIAGGQGKEQDFSPLIPAVRAHARGVFLIGQDAPLMAKALADAGVYTQLCDSLEQAVTQAFGHARPGDTVLLSPACASLDMFRNYVHRSACFVDAVRELAADHGELA